MRRLGGNRAGEMRISRFLRNPAVTPDEMAATARGRLAWQGRGRHVLAIQDTTVVRSAGGGGTYLHAVIAVDAEDGALLGLIDGSFWTRTGGARATRRARPRSEKQSRRWLDGAETAAEALPAAAEITVIADRESDIYDAFGLAPAGVHLLVRAAQDRALEDGGRLFAASDDWVRQGSSVLDLPAAPGRPARAARLALRFDRVCIARPKGADKRAPDTVELSLVDIREESPPPGAAPIHWRLLTSRPVETAADAWEIAALYRRRWSVEQLFRTLKKKGFDIEGCLVAEGAPLHNLVMATLIAAVTIQQMVHARDGAPDNRPLRPVTDAFDDQDLPLLAAFCDSLEGNTAKQKNPHPPGSLAYAAWVCARLGGWTGYYGKPGPITILNGWIEFQTAKRTTQIIARINV